MKKGHLIIALIGALLFAWVLVHAGWSAILQQLKAMRVALPILIALSGFRLLLQTLAWSKALKAEGLFVEAARLMGVRLASQAMGYLTFLGPVLSEPMKVKLLETPSKRTNLKKAI